MSVIAWTDDFRTGLGLVDRQHRRLVELINRLEQAVAASLRIDDPAVTFAYERLRNHAASHFADEERLMANAGVDSRHREAHGLAHAQLLELIDSLWRSRTNVPDPARALLDVLSPWFVQHALGVDMLMAQQIKSLREGASPERSYELAATAESAESRATIGALRHLFQSVTRRNLALEQNVRERTTELEHANLALVEAQHRLDQQDRNLEGQIRERTQKLQRANRALTAANHRLKDVARTDGLLGIANRASFDEHFKAEWLRARREASPLAVLMIDVDHFKRFNDTYGHPAGDCCLQKIAQAVAALSHRPGDFVARYGGEELVAVLPNTDMDGARACAEQICNQIRAMKLEHCTSQPAGCVTVSIGASCAVPGYTSASAAELLERADQALYRAKSEGRDRVQCATDEGTATPDDAAPPRVRSPSFLAYRESGRWMRHSSPAAT